MPSKKLTAKKREELKRMKNKGPKSSFSPVLIILVLIVIVAIAGAYFVLSGEDTTEDEQDTNGGIVETALTANEDTAITDKNIDAQIDVLENDEYDEEGILEIINVTTPSHGLAESKDNIILYAPEHNYTGPDSFNYTISDGNESDTTTVYIVVEELNPYAHISTSKGDITLEDK